VNSGRNARRDALAFVHSHGKSKRWSSIPDTVAATGMTKRFKRKTKEAENQGVGPSSVVYLLTPGRTK
jgi:hypothetical protein